MYAREEIAQRTRSGREDIRKLYDGGWTGFFYFRTGPSTEHGNGYSGSHRRREIAELQAPEEGLSTTELATRGHYPHFIITFLFQYGPVIVTAAQQISLVPRGHLVCSRMPFL
jgi:hypothetical protein